MFIDFKFFFFSNYRLFFSIFPSIHLFVCFVWRHKKNIIIIMKNWWLYELRPPKKEKRIKEITNDYSDIESKNLSIMTIDRISIFNSILSLSCRCGWSQQNNRNEENNIQIAISVKFIKTFFKIVLISFWIIFNVSILWRVSTKFKFQFFISTLCWSEEELKIKIHSFLSDLNRKVFIFSIYFFISVLIHSLILTILPRDCWKKTSRLKRWATWWNGSK